MGGGRAGFLIANEMREGVRKEVYLYCKGQENRFTSCCTSKESGTRCISTDKHSRVPACV